jgi:hypothetical protein
MTYFSPSFFFASSSEEAQISNFKCPLLGRIGESFDAQRLIFSCMKTSLKRVTYEQFVVTPKEQGLAQKPAPFCPLPKNDLVVESRIQILQKDYYVPCLRFFSFFPLFSSRTAQEHLNLLGKTSTSNETHQASRRASAKLRPLEFYCYRLGVCFYPQVTAASDPAKTEIPRCCNNAAPQATPGRSRNMTQRIDRNHRLGWEK